MSFSAKSLPRCPWCVGKEDYEHYHDTEWGVAVYDDQTLFEFLILEGAQAGLSWYTILKKRADYRAVFHQFDVQKVAAINDEELAEALKNPGIIRNRLKVASTVSNAKAFITIQEEFGSFSTYLWAFVDGKPIVNNWEKMDEAPANTAISDKLAKDLKKRGFKFVGSTIMYAFMQATGMVNDHLTSCFRYKVLVN
jgi:DNA-3-methyladenine glycosylase I